jgi:hypothetical protein
MTSASPLAIVIPESAERLSGTHNHRAMEEGRSRIQISRRSMLIGPGLAAARQTGMTIVKEGRVI